MSERGRLRWLCRRGMKELDELLAGFLDDRYETLDERGQAAFRRLLELQDPELMGYLMGRDGPDDPELADVVRRIQQHAGYQP